MRALSIRQPWAYMILHYGKDIENRTWPTNVSGRVLIHASKGMTKAEWYGAWRFAREDVGVDTSIRGSVADMPFGGIVGSVEIVGCVQRSESRWFEGPYGFVLRNPIVLPFRPLRGSLGFFTVEVV